MSMGPEPEHEEYEAGYAAELERARQNALEPADGWEDANLSGPPLSEHGQETNPEDWAPREIYSPYQVALQPPRPRLIPHIGHVILFFVLAVVLLGVGQVLGVYAIEHLHFFGHKNFNALAELADDDARLSIPIQALSYLLIVIVAVPVFTLLWNEPFGEGVHWNRETAKRRLFRLGLLGLAAGFGINLFGNFLPMPKDPPIIQAMLKTPLGAWMMLIFGVTAAPLLEEMAFRGFLLPGLINCFRWLARKGSISDQAAKLVGVPVSIAVTSFCFALMHSAQVSHAWGPLVLIGTVSVVLCIVRLAMNSVAAGVVVHAAYNFTLFSAVLVETGGFRHLEKLTV
jgi:uncharacterized protein